MALANVGAHVRREVRHLVASSPNRNAHGSSVPIVFRLDQRESEFVSERARLQGDEPKARRHQQEDLPTKRRASGSA
jgi:hypothetical protein